MKSEVETPGARVSAVLAALLLAAVPIAAQVYDRPLTEQDLQRLAPVLRAEKAGDARLAKQEAERKALEERRAAARQQAVAAVAQGEDPLDWLTKRTTNAATPSTARYDAACSRALTQSAGDPSAVFSFGLAAPPAWLAVWKGRDGSGPTGNRGQAPNQPGAQRPGAMRPESVVQQTRAFYSSRGFQYQGEPAPFEWQFLAPDRMIGATLMGLNVLGNVEACRQMADGPTVVLKAEGDAFVKGPARPPVSANRELVEALEAAGLRREDYQNLKEQLRVAQADARDPARLTLPPSATVEQRESMAIREKNVAFYKQHADLISQLLAGVLSQSTR